MQDWLEKLRRKEGDEEGLNIEKMFKSQLTKRGFDSSCGFINLNLCNIRKGVVKRIEAIIF